MKLKSASALTIACVLLLFLSLSPSLHAAEESDHEEIASDAQLQLEGLLHFRDVFRDVAAKHGQDEDAVRKMLILPSADDFEVPSAALEATSAHDALATLVEQGKKTSAISLYQNGVNTPFGRKRDSDETFKAHGPVTFIVFPPLLQEMASEPVFAEILERPSAFRKRYGQYLKGAMDSSYDWEKMERRPVTLASRFRLGSIDDGKGEPLVQLIVLDAGFGSLDTVGPLAQTSETYLRRINALINLLPPEAYRNLHFIGYSRGTIVALDLIAKASRAPEGSYPFFKELKGLVTLGGVIYGSDLPDHPFTPLKIGLPDILRSLPAPEPIFLLDQAYDFLSTLIKHSLDPAGVVKRLEVFVMAVNAAVNELKTSSRLSWWRQNQLPAGFPIYSINGIMPIRSMTAWPFADTPFFGIGLLDYIGIKPSARRLFQLTGNYVNDGQIIDVKGRMWAGLLKKFNPRQKSLHIQNLGNVTTHHLALGNRAAIKQVNGKGNPFRRDIMVEAIGAYVLESQR